MKPVQQNQSKIKLSIQTCSKSKSKYAESIRYNNAKIKLSSKQSNIVNSDNKCSTNRKLTPRNRREHPVYFNSKCNENRLIRKLPTQRHYICCWRTHESMVVSDFVIVYGGKTGGRDLVCGWFKLWWWAFDLQKKWRWGRRRKEYLRRRMYGRMNGEFSIFQFFLKQNHTLISVFSPFFSMRRGFTWGSGIHGPKDAFG